MAYFELNASDPEARQYYYVDIPRFYTFEKGNVKKIFLVGGRNAKVNLTA